MAVLPLVAQLSLLYFFVFVLSCFPSLADIPDPHCARSGPSDAAADATAGSAIDSKKGASRKKMSKKQKKKNPSEKPKQEQQMQSWEPYLPTRSSGQSEMACSDSDSDGECEWFGREDRHLCPQIPNLKSRAKKSLQLVTRASAEHRRLCRGQPHILCNLYVLGGTLDAFHRAHQSGALRSEATLKFVDLVARNALGQSDDRPPTAERFASTVVTPLLPVYYLARAFRPGTSKCFGLHVQNASRFFLAARLVGCKVSQPINACECAGVMCWRDGSEEEALPRDALMAKACPSGDAIQIVGLVPGSRKQIKLTPTKLKEALAAFSSELRFLELTFWPRFAELPHLPKLRTLLLAGAPFRFPKGVLRTLELLSFSLQGQPTSATSLESICNLENLKVLAVEDGVEALPECIGEKLLELRVLDVRSGFFGSGNANNNTTNINNNNNNTNNNTTAIDEQDKAPLPKSLEKLSKLVEFVAFEHNFEEFEDCPQSSNCVPSFETTRDCNTDDGCDIMKFRCGTLGWSQDLNELPIFKWPNLEKFWVDGNSLFASNNFFANAAKAWPKIRTIDLYDNKIDSDGQELLELTKCQDLHQVQLHQNNLHGVVPLADMLALKNPVLERFTLSFNPRLEGVLPSNAQLGSAFLVEETAITVGKERANSGGSRKQGKNSKSKTAQETDDAS